jgi:hypothetical protein
VETNSMIAGSPTTIGTNCILIWTCSPHKLGQTLDVVSAARRITMIYQRLAKVFLICSDMVYRRPGAGRDP